MTDGTDNVSIEDMVRQFQVCKGAQASLLLLAQIESDKELQSLLYQTINMLEDATRIQCKRIPREIRGLLTESMFTGGLE